MKVVLDSSVYIRAWNDPGFVPRYREFTRSVLPRTYASAVVVGECWAGVRDRQGRQIVEEAFRPFERAGRILSPSYSDWKKGGQVIRALFDRSPSHRTKLAALWNDILIVLSSSRIGATVYTFNRMDFELIRSIHVFALVVF